jgi:7-carboxy-7-deazaguanine synthase
MSEYFVSLQGEGPYAGTPMLFLRLSGCNATPDFMCYKWCDTPHRNDVKYEWPVERVIELIKETGLKHVLFTGGEPMLQKDAVRYIVDALKKEGYIFHMETNASIRPYDTFFTNFLGVVSFSPKREEDALAVAKLFRIAPYYSIVGIMKLVSDGTDEERLRKWFGDIPDEKKYVMPLTTGDAKKDKKIMQDVWDMCVRNNWRFSPRLHVWIGRK